MLCEKLGTIHEQLHDVTSWNTGIIIDAAVRISKLIYKNIDKVIEFLNIFIVIFFI
jgi:hypothetical protein